MLISGVDAGRVGVIVAFVSWHRSDRIHMKELQSGMYRIPSDAMDAKSLN